jgi:MFS family permease
VGLANTTSGAFTALGPLLGGAIASLWGYPALFVVALAMMLIALGILRFLVQEPRKVEALP